MNRNLFRKLYEYNEITSELIEAAEKENYDEVEKLLVDRQNVIESIKLLTFTQDEFKDRVIELMIIENQKKLDAVIKEKRSILKVNINNISVRRTANKNYNKQHYTKISIINEQI